MLTLVPLARLRKCDLQSSRETPGKSLLVQISLLICITISDEFAWYDLVQAFNSRIHQAGWDIQPTCREVGFKCFPPAPAASLFDLPSFETRAPEKAGSSASSSHRQSCSDPEPPLISSLDVLRLDLSRSSLDHLSSSMIFGRGASKTIRTNMHDDSSASDASHRFIYRERSHRMAARWFHHNGIQQSSTRVAVLTDDTNYPFEPPKDHNQVPDDEYNRRKHVCPICPTRFNRPSSLNIHLNSHTRATREF